MGQRPASSRVRHKSVTFTGNPCQIWHYSVTERFHLRALFALCCTLAACPPLFAQFTVDREPPGPSSRRSGLAITEIHYNPRPVPGLATNLTKEFIEVYNSKPWAEDISGFRIGGAVAYTFPSNTVLAAGGYLVVARVPDIIRTNYNITNVFGPWTGANTNRLPTEAGTVQLLNRQGALLLSTSYQDSPPWPEAADGTGHSLSLVRPSYGEDDPRAWAQSDTVGGSPGGPEPLSNEPLASIFINEWQNHSDPNDWIELYNHSNVPVDLSGAWLSDDPATNKFRITNGLTIGPRGFVSFKQTQLGFELFAGGETIFLWNSNQTRVIDVIDFRGASNNVSQGRWPDGGPNVYGLNYTFSGEPNNAPNPPPIRYQVGISEIMYNPISGSVDDEYIEIHNRGNSPVDIRGWEFVTGIGFTFPSNSPAVQAMPPGAYWVIARNPTNLFAIYSNLNTNNTFGPYTGTLANGGERVVFAAADYDRVQNGPITIIEKLQVPVSDVTYGDGGKWGFWSDGDGSSLELIDVGADVRHPSNWADSSDVNESQWTAIEMDVPLGESLGEQVNDRLIIGLQAVGECLLDEIEVRADHGPNLVANGGFESGLAGWTLQGSHDFSTIENEGFDGNKSLHLRAGSRGDNQSNRILSMPFAAPVPPGTRIVSLRCKAKWLRGHPEILLRLRGSATEAYGRMALPRRLGSPGLPNSRAVANAGPAIYAVKHSPVLPASGEPVVITARVTDPQRPIVTTLRYRLDPSPDFSDVIMVDDGTAGDAIAGDGILSATIPSQNSGTVVAFYIEARDAQNAIGTFPQGVAPPPGLDRCWPSDALTRECIVRWGEVQMPGDFATYHLWVSAVNSNRWHIRDTQNNTEMDGTFVYNNSRVIYNAMPLFSGSPWHRTNATAGPAGIYRVDYEMNFPGDEPLLGSTDFVLNNPGNPDRLTISDLSALVEQTVYKIFEGMDMVHNHRRYIHFFVNGSQRSTAYERPGNFIFEDSQQPNGDMQAQWGLNGDLYKVEDWFEFNDNGFDIAAYDDADLTRRTVLIDGLPTQVPGPYRYKFRKRSVNIGASANNYAPLFALIDAISPPDNPTNSVIDLTRLEGAVDWEAWMRHFAVQRAVGNWDSFGWDRGKNDYLAFGPSGFLHMPWDIDYSLGLGRPANEPLFASNEPRVLAMFNTPAIQRAYWRAFDDLVNGPFTNTRLDPFIDAHQTALLANNINIDTTAVAATKTYIAQRRAFIQTQLASVAAPFAVFGPVTFDTTNNLIVIEGSAPVGVKEIQLNGTAYPITWISPTNFSLRVVLAGGTNNLQFQGFDRFGNPVAGASRSLAVNYTGPVFDPKGAIVITEVLSRSLQAGARFIEFQNRSPFSFDLAGFEIEGVNYTFPLGSIVTNGQIFVLVRDRDVFRQTYGNMPIFGVLSSSPTPTSRIAIVEPGIPTRFIDGVQFEADEPWPLTTNGVSLQLIDLSQDNDRAANWAIDSVAMATPGAPNSVAGQTTPFAPLWLNEVQVESLVGPLDNAGDPEPWIEIYNAGVTPMNLDGYYLANNFTTNLLQWPLPAISLEPGEHRLIWADGEPEETSGTNFHTSFRLDPVGKLALVRLVAGEPQIVDHFSWRLRSPNVTHGSYPDGQAVYRDILQDPSPRAANFRRPLAIMINEWMASNSNGIRDPADTDQDDWFELYNAESFAIDLSNFYLTDDTNNLTKYRIPANGQYRLASRGFLLLWADSETNQNAGNRIDLHVDFKLSASSGSIALTAPDGTTVIDMIAYGQQTNDISECRFSDGSNARYWTQRSTPRGFNSLYPLYNSPPIFPAIPNYLVAPGQVITISVRASEPDSNTVNYAMISVPPGSQINQGGLYRWTVPAAQPPGDYAITLSAFDNGVPSRSDLVTFYMTVTGTLAPVGVLRPVIHTVAAPGNQITFSMETETGRTYRVWYTDDLSSEAWTQLDRDFVAAQNPASITDGLGNPKRFYKVQRVD